MKQAKTGGLYWGKFKVATRADTVARLARYDVVILNESNLYDLPNGEDGSWSQAALEIKRLNSNCKVGVSFNAISTFQKNGIPNVYFPIQQKIFKAATDLNAWLLINGQHTSQVKPEDQIQTWMFDIRVPMFRYALADIINTALSNYQGVDFYHLDELHRTLGFLVNRYPTGLPTDSEWTAANTSLIRLIDWPVMSNGTYDLSKYHKTKSRGRYVQNANDIGRALEWLSSDMLLPAKQRYSIVNLVDQINTDQWARVAYATGLTVQRYALGQKENFADPNLITLTFNETA